MSDSPNTIPVTEISRPIIDAKIELLIALLDTLDPDPDLESTGDEEPWLGAPEGFCFTNWEGLNLEGNDDHEDDGDDLEPDCDDENGCDNEWELGWTDLQGRTGKYSISWSMPSCRFSMSFVRGDGTVFAQVDKTLRRVLVSGPISQDKGFQPGGRNAEAKTVERNIPQNVPLLPNTCCIDCCLRYFDTLPSAPHTRPTLP